MSGIKREMDRLESVELTAIAVAIKAGALRRCDVHEEILIDVGDADAVKRAYAIGSNVFKAGEVDTKDRTEFMYAIKLATESGSDSCPYCDKLRAE